MLDPASFWSYSDTKDSPPRIGELNDDGGALAGCSCLHCTENRKLPKTTRWEGYDDIDPKNRDVHLNDEHFILFPRKIMGFVLKSREWGM